METKLREQQIELLDALVHRVAPQLNRLFRMEQRPEAFKGSCVTWSELIVEALKTAGVAAEVRPVHIVIANPVGLEYLQGKIDRDEAIKKDGCTQILGEIDSGQQYQHAVCYVKDWDVVIDLSMMRRSSGRVPAEAYWFGPGKEKPWWMFSFIFRDYKLTNYARINFPLEVDLALSMIQATVRRYLCKPT
jgi:hypothetical protein